MSSYDDMSKTLNALSESPRISMKSIDTSAVVAASRAMSESLASVAEFQRPIMDESLLKVMSDIRPTMLAVEAVNLNLAKTMQSISSSIRPTMDMINENVAMFDNNYSEILRGFRELGCSLSSLAEQVYEESEEDACDDFNSDDEILEALQEQESDPVGFQERFANWTEKRKKKYSIVRLLIIILLEIFVVPFLQDTVGKPVMSYIVSKVRELPNSSSEVIDELQEGGEGLIIEDVPYYYKVTYVDENGDAREGYVAKKNLKIINEKDDAESSDEFV